MEHTGDKTRLGLLLTVGMSILAVPAQAQNRGVYPLGMSATNSGVTPQPGFTYVNQLLLYSRNHARARLVGDHRRALRRQERTGLRGTLRPYQQIGVR